MNNWFFVVVFVVIWLFGKKYTFLPNSYKWLNGVPRVYCCCCCCYCCCCCITSVVSDSVRPHRRQPTRLLRPWDSRGKNTGVGCHFLLQCVKVKDVTQKTCIPLPQKMSENSQIWETLFWMIFSLPFSPLTLWELKNSLLWRILELQDC